MNAETGWAKEGHVGTDRLPAIPRPVHRVYRGEKAGRQATRRWIISDDEFLFLLLFCVDSMAVVVLSEKQIKRQEDVIFFFWDESFRFFFCFFMGHDESVFLRGWWSVKGCYAFTFMPVASRIGFCQEARARGDHRKN